MKKLLLFGPLLWLRRIIIILLIILGVLGLILFLAANSPLAIKKAVDTFAGDYNISYNSMSGNALTGVEIHDPKFKNNALAKSIKLQWNPNTLAEKKLTISTLHVKQGNMNVIQELISSFSNGSNETSEVNESTTLPVSIVAGDIDISLLPFVQNDILIQKARLKANNLVVNEKGLGLEGISIDIESNVTNISLEGNINDRVLNLSHINVADINMNAVLGLMSHDDNSTKKMSSDTQTKTNKQSIFIPKFIHIATFKTNILPFEYEPLIFKAVALKAKSIVFNVDDKIIEKVKLDLNASTNLANVIYDGHINQNNLIGQIELIPKPQLYEKYSIPLRHEAIKKIIIDISASQKSVIADVRTEGKQILQAKNDAFNMDINMLTSHVVYDLNSSQLKAISKATIDTPYAKGIRINNSFYMDKNISYEGTIQIKTVLGMDAKFTKPLKNLNLLYVGTVDSIDVQLDTEALEGNFTSNDFKTAQIHLESKKVLRLGEFVSLPSELEDAEAEVMIDMPLHFSDMKNLKGKISILSNIVNVDAKILYGKETTLQGFVDIPEASLLKSYSSDVKWKSLSHIATAVKFSDDVLNIKLKEKALAIETKYDISKGTVTGKLNVDGFVTNISGNTKKTLKIETKLKSLDALHKSINTFYILEKFPNIKGDIDATIQVNAMKTADIVLNAPKLIYKVDNKNTQTIKNVKLLASVDDKKIVLKSYNVVYNKQKYFANKKSVIHLGDTIQVSDFWLNDTLRVTGNYTPKEKKGHFVAKSNRFQIKDEMIDMDAKLDLNIGLDGNDTSVAGKILLLEGKLNPNLEGKSFASDSDIIIIQEMNKKKQSSFMDNLTLALQIETKKALRLKQGPINIRLKPDFTINKEKGTELLYLGSVQFLKGGSYIFEEKKFVLDKSQVYFTGDISKPSLDIKANYKSINHFITIAVTGTPSAPKLKFSSSPSLTREQILSVILFDSEAGGDAKSGNDMMKMMGGAMAKAALADAGVKVDHLAFGEGNSIEVGKKLNDKTTVIYINGDIPKVKLKYQHTKRTESVIGVSEESQSVDIIYKRDF